MIVLVVGFFLIIIGVFAMRYSEFITVLKEEDNENWLVLDSPSPHALIKVVGVYSWLLSRGYEKSASANVQALGEKNRDRAQFTKFSLTIGAVLVVVGFGLALAGF